MCYLCERDVPWPDKLDWLIKEMEYCLRPQLALSTQRTYIRKRLADPLASLLTAVDIDEELSLSPFSADYLLHLLYLIKRVEAVIGINATFWCFTHYSCDRIQKDLKGRGINTYSGLTAFIAYDLRGKEDAKFVEADLDNLSERMAEHGNKDIGWSVTSVDNLTGIITIHAGKGVVPKHVFGLELLEPIEYRYPNVFTLH